LIHAENFREKKKELITRMVFYTLISMILSLYLTNLIVVNHFSGKYFNGQGFKFYSPLTLFKICSYFYHSQDRFIALHFTYIIRWNVGEILIYTSTVFTILTGIVGYIITILRLRNFLFSDRYGTARFLSDEEVVDSNIKDDPDTIESYKKHERYGIFMGGYIHKSGDPINWVDRKTKVSETKHLLRLYHFGEQHMIIFAPTGSGKTASLVINQLVTYPDSVFVLDISGELCTSTSGYRNKEFNNIIIRLELSASQGSARYNPLEEIRIGTEFELADAQKVAEILVVTPEKDLSDHWIGKAYDLLGAVMLHILYTKKNRSLNSVALFLSGINPDDSNHVYAGENGWLSEMMGMPETKTADNPNASIHVKGYAKLQNISEKEAFTELLGKGIIGSDGVNINVKTSAAALRNSNALEERSSVISTAQKPLSLYKDPIIARNTSTSDFKLSDLQSLSRPVSLYLIIPTDQRERIKPLVRLFITQFIHKTQNSTFNKKHELSCIWDEFPEFGKIPIIESAFATIRKYKVRFVIICQDYLQLTRNYGDNQTIYSNCGVRVAFAPNEPKTSKLLSNSTGDMTYIAKTTSYTQNTNPTQIFNGGSINTSTQETQRKLMTESEIEGMGDNMLIMIEGQPSIKGHKLFWYFSDYFNEKVYNVRNTSSGPSKKYPPLNVSQKIIRKAS
jgi:type IV secretion system protein VirD4